MSIDSRSTQQAVRPSYPQPTRARKAATIFLAVLVSSTLLGGVLSAFEMRSAETAISRASATEGLAVRKINSVPRV